MLTTIGKFSSFDVRDVCAMRTFVHASVCAQQESELHDVGFAGSGKLYFVKNFVFTFDLIFFQRRTFFFGSFDLPCRM